MLPLQRYVFAGTSYGPSNVMTEHNLYFYCFLLQLVQTVLVTMCVFRIYNHADLKNYLNKAYLQQIYFHFSETVVDPGQEKFIVFKNQLWELLARCPLCCGECSVSEIEPRKGTMVRACNIYICNIYHIYLCPKCRSCHKAILVITVRAHCNHLDISSTAQAV